MSPIRRAVRWLLLACALAATGVRAADAPPAGGLASASATTQEDETHQVLVLLRMAPPHFRADGNYAGSYTDGMARGARRRVAQQLASENGLRLVSDWPMPVLGLDCYVMAVPASDTPEQMAERLSHDRRVEWAQTLQVYRAQEAAAPDPLYGAQPTARAWRLAELHEIATGRAVRVALVDSGADAAHPDLAGQVAVRADFVGPERDAPPPELHGTAVAGLVAAREGNGQGIVGVAPQARLMALRACRQESETLTRCSSLSLAKALYYALNNDANVINMSLSGPEDRLLGRLLDAALARGITIVAAWDGALPAGGFPASHPGVVAVAGVEGPVSSAAALRAPARDLPTTGLGGSWRFVSGSSYAAAQVSGLFALLHELDPGGGNAAVVRASDGSIDTCASLLRARREPCACACAQVRADVPVARR